MQAHAFIFKKIFFIFNFLLILFFCNFSFAQTTQNSKNVEQNVLDNAYSGYGEFGDGEDELEDERFFQQGRLFGIGFGGGYTTVTGEASKLYQGGLPSLDFRIQAWFDFHFALSLGLQNSRHSYDIQPDGLTTVNLFRFIPQIKYYFDTRHLSAPLTFIGPHLIAGGGFYKRTDNIGNGSASSSATTDVIEQQATGFNAGVGFELTIKPRKTYLSLETLAHFVSFNDDNSNRFANVGIQNRRGTWWSFSAILLFTW
jgi:hypothetical protein